MSSMDVDDSAFLRWKHNGCSKSGTTALSARVLHEHPSPVEQLLTSVRNISEATSINLKKEELN